MRRGRRKRRRKTRRTDDKGRWTKRVAQDDIGSMTVTSAAWSLGTKARPKKIRRAS